MGSKHSTTTSWSVDDWAFGTGANAVPLEEVIDGAKMIPEKYFGGRVIGNDASMQQMQRDLLAFDNIFKRIFRRKKYKQSKKENNYDEQYYPENQQYYDRNHQAIPEEDEEQLSENNHQTNDRNTSQ